MKRALATLAAMSFATAAHAQVPTFGAFVEGGSGVTIGGGDGFSVVQRARTLVRLGGTMTLDDMPNQQFSVAVLADIEPRVALGIDGQWGYWASKTFLFQAGVIGYLVPQTLFGFTAGMRVRIPIGKMFSLLPGITVNGFLAGSDLPDNAAIVSGLFVLGFHVSL